MALAALLIYLVYFLLAFVVRGLLQWRGTGDSGFRMATERPGSPQWWARLAFVVALVSAAVAPILALVGWLEPIAALDGSAVGFTGLVITLVGVAATFVAQVAMGASWRVGVDPDEQTDLVRRWPFTVVRNPIFTAMLVAAVGLTLMVPNVVAIAALVLLAWALRYQVVVVEEPYLARTHGSSYLEYASQVGRFLPGIGKLRDDAVEVRRST
ncbi:MAG: methyltransferase family protein [Microthrixaceae bacterium]